MAAASEGPAPTLLDGLESDAADSVSGPREALPSDAPLFAALAAEPARPDASRPDAVRPEALRAVPAKQKGRGNPRPVQLSLFERLYRLISRR